MIRSMDVLLVTVLAGNENQAQGSSPGLAAARLPHTIAARRWIGRSAPRWPRTWPAAQTAIRVRSGPSQGRRGGERPMAAANRPVVGSGTLTQTALPLTLEVTSVDPGEATHDPHSITYRSGHRL